jgi:hypothetical protein
MTLRTRVLVLALTALLWGSLSAIWCLIYVRDHLALGQRGTYETDADFQVIAFLYVHGASLCSAQPALGGRSSTLLGGLP